MRDLTFLSLTTLSFASPLKAEGHTAAENAISGLSSKPMSAGDLITMPRLGAPIVTPSGLYAVYSVAEADSEPYARASNYYVIDLKTPGSTPIEVDLGLDAYALAFGTDNLVYFLSEDHPDSEAGKYARLWRAALAGDGSVTQRTLVADIPDAGISDFLLAPTNDKVAFLVTVSRDCAILPCNDASKSIGSGRLYEGDAGFYRHWDRWVESGKFNRVFVFDVEDGQITSEGVPIDGTDPETGLVANTPTMPFGGREDLTWAPDGSGLYFVAREANAQEPTSTDLDIYFSDLSGGAPKVLTGANEAHDSGPSVSPDGKTLAYLAMARPGYESDRLIVHLRDLATGDTQALTQETDLSFGGLTWSADGSYLLATAADVLDTPVFRIDPASGEVTKLDLMAGNEAHIGSISPLPDDHLLFTRDSVGVPSELFLF